MKYKKCGEVWVMELGDFTIEGSLEFVQKQALTLIDMGLVELS